MKRKLKDLKENECIKVNTLKQAEYFIKKLGWNNTTPKQLVGNSIIRGENINFAWIYDVNSEVEYSASDFIKPKKSKFKKYVEQELAKVDGRLYDIELEFALIRSRIIKPTPNLPEGGILNYPPNPKEPIIALYNSDKATSKMELTELPEKWCVAVTEENKHILSEFRGDEDLLKGNIRFGFINHKGIYGINPKYTEISFSDFERLVLKKQTNDKNVVNMEVGKWYKGTYIDNIVLDNKAIFFVQDITLGVVTAYGFNYKGMWVDSIRRFTQLEDIKQSFVLATNEEVETALINEAKRRGFKEGVTVDVLNLSESHNPNMVLEGYFQTGELLDKGFLWFGTDVCQLIFDNGKWADVIEQPKQEIDWSKPGQLVRANDGEGSAIIMTTGKYNKNVGFSGVVLVTDSVCDKLGAHDIWDEKDFILFNGSIGLKNND